MACEIKTNKMKKKNVFDLISPRSWYNSVYWIAFSVKHPKFTKTCLYLLNVFCSGRVHRYVYGWWPSAKNSSCIRRPTKSTLPTPWDSHDISNHSSSQGEPSTFEGGGNVVFVRNINEITRTCPLIRILCCCDWDVDPVKCLNHFCRCKNRIFHLPSPLKNGLMLFPSVWLMQISLLWTFFCTWLSAKTHAERGVAGS